jgi:catechol 2,3-dioxygenase-like lactoylglutathione lyase family enzyme
MTPRSRLAPVLFLLLAAAAFAPLAWSDLPVVAAERVAGVSITVGDLDKSVEFFTDVLDFDVESENEIAGDAVERLFAVFPARIRTATMRLGDERVTLMQFIAPEGRAFPADSRSMDYWFQHIAIVVRDMDEAYARLREHRVRHISSGPQTLPDWNPNAGGIKAFYFTDPDGHALELIWFPKGKGDPRWQQPTTRLFLGIDHTAIGVSDTPASLAFYRDLLGLRVAGTSENYGIEQERLNAVFGARVDITGLRAGMGPGVEFLEYLAPGGGRPYPADSRANDLWHWHTTVTVRNVEDAFVALRDRGVQLVSPQVVTLNDPHFGEKAFLARDPDGHAVLVTED